MRQRRMKEISTGQAREAATLAISKGSLNMETFTRLYEAGQQRDRKINENKQAAVQEQEKELKAFSIHRNAVGDKHVFERLYHTKK